jgi:hypothetical protein
LFFLEATKEAIFTGDLGADVADMGQHDSTKLEFAQWVYSYPSHLLAPWFLLLLLANGDFCGE